MDISSFEEPAALLVLKVLMNISEVAAALPLLQRIPADATILKSKVG